VPAAVPDATVNVSVDDFEVPAGLPGTQLRVEGENDAEAPPGWPVTESETSKLPVLALVTLTGRVTVPPVVVTGPLWAFTVTLPTFFPPTTTDPELDLAELPPVAVTVKA
jgi:hypothetical protein